MRLFRRLKKLSRVPKRKILQKFRLSVIFSLIFLHFPIVFAQSRIENRSTEQGLPYKTVRAVWKTRDGDARAAIFDSPARFAGDEAGLRRFRGGEFSFFSTVTKNCRAAAFFRFLPVKRRIIR